jgi:hypothetical protein
LIYYIYLYFIFFSFFFWLSPICLAIYSCLYIICLAIYSCLYIICLAIYSCLYIIFSCIGDQLLLWTLILTIRLQQVMYSMLILFISFANLFDNFLNFFIFYYIFWLLNIHRYKCELFLLIFYFFKRLFCHRFIGLLKIDLLILWSNCRKWLWVCITINHLHYFASVITTINNLIYRLLLKFFMFAWFL